MNVREVMPMYPGYAIGNIIKKDDLMLPILIKERETCERALHEQEETKEKLGRENLSPSKQEEFLLCNLAINNLKRSLESVNKHLQELYAKASLFSIQETLPIDTSSAKVRIENKTFPTEKLDYLLFDSTVHDVDDKVRNFISELFLGDAHPTCLPSSTVNAIVRKIESLQKTAIEVSLIGSFITLPRVRTIDPIILRQNAIISDDLKKNASDYYVLTEAVLGAVFLGIGRYATVLKPIEGILDARAMESISMISFVSQGAIPKIGKTLQEANLWMIYSSWKEQLQEDIYTGYPIRFKFRELTNVLQESDQL